MADGNSHDWQGAMLGARRSNATGRSMERRSIGFHKRKRKLRGPWVALTLDLMDSLAYRAMGIHARRVLDFLMREHLRHAGTQNGRLAAPHRQLVAENVTKRDCLKGIEELIALGLIVRTARGGRLAGRDQPALYRITFLPDEEGEEPTNDWNRITEADIAALKHDQKTISAHKRGRRAAAHLNGDIEGAPQLRGLGRGKRGENSRCEAPTCPSFEGQVRDQLRGCDGISEEVEGEEAEATDDRSCAG